MVAEEFTRRLAGLVAAYHNALYWRLVRPEHAAVLALAFQVEILRVVLEAER
jgi:hypothetical protein